MMMSWNAPRPNKWLILQLPTAQADPRNSDKKSQQNLATLCTVTEMTCLPVLAECVDPADDEASR